jgi:hypothetical protein
MHSQLLLPALGRDVEQPIPELVVAARGSLDDLVLVILDSSCLLGLCDFGGGRHCEWRRWVSRGCERLVWVEVERRGEVVAKSRRRVKTYGETHVLLARDRA